MKEDNVKKLHSVWLQLYDILKKQNYGENKKISGCQGLGEERDESTEHRGILKRWDYSVWYYNYTFVQTHEMYNPRSDP